MRERGRQAQEERGEAQDRAAHISGGEYILRMDQPYSRIADALLDYQYWAPNDPQKDIYDDTGWTFGELGNVQVARVTDVKVLDASMKSGGGRGGSARRRGGTGDVFLINHNADNTLITLRYRFPNASFEAAEEPFEAAGHKFNRGSFIVRNVAADGLGKAGAELGVRVYAVGGGARREDASGAGGAHRRDAHMAQHAERRLVAPGIRPIEGAV